MHHSIESMRDRAFTKGRCAFRSDAEYQAALRGELDDVREDFLYEANEDPDDGEDAGDLEDLTDEEAVTAELERLEKRIGAHFLEILEQFMKDCSGAEEPGYLPFPPVRDKEVLATFCSGSEALRLRYGAYGLAADRIEGREVVKTWMHLDADVVLGDWDMMLAEKAAEAEAEKEDLEDERKSEFFDDLPGVLADRKRGAAFIDFVTSASPVFADEKDGAAPGETCLPFSERFWLAWDGAECEFRLKRHPGLAGAMATWDKEEFLEKLREVAWDDPDCQDCILGGGLEKAWDALDDAWWDEDEDDLVVNSVGEFLTGVEDVEKDTRVGAVQKDVAVCEEADTGRVEMRMAWSRTFPADALLTFSRSGREETFSGVPMEKTFSGVPLAFLRWWAFGKARGW